MVDFCDSAYIHTDVPKITIWDYPGCYHLYVCSLVFPLMVSHFIYSHCPLPFPQCLFPSGWVYFIQSYAPIHSSYCIPFMLSLLTVWIYFGAEIHYSLWPQYICIWYEKGLGVTQITYKGIGHIKVLNQQIFNFMISDGVLLKLNNQLGYLLLCHLVGIAHCTC